MVKQYDVELDYYEIGVNCRNIGLTEESCKQLIIEEYGNKLNETDLDHFWCGFMNGCSI